MFAKILNYSRCNFFKFNLQFNKYFIEVFNFELKDKLYFLGLIPEDAVEYLVAQINSKPERINFVVADEMIKKMLGDKFPKDTFTTLKEFLDKNGLELNIKTGCPVLRHDTIHYYSYHYGPNFFDGEEEFMNKYRLISIKDYWRECLKPFGDSFIYLHFHFFMFLFKETGQVYLDDLVNDPIEFELDLSYEFSMYDSPKQRFLKRKVAHFSNIMFIPDALNTNGFYLKHNQQLIYVTYAADEKDVDDIIHAEKFEDMKKNFNRCDFNKFTVFILTFEDKFKINRDDEQNIEYFVMSFGTMKKKFSFLSESNKPFLDLKSVCRFCGKKVCFIGTNRFFCSEHGILIEEQSVIYKTRYSDDYVRKLPQPVYRLHICPKGKECYNENCSFAKNKSELDVWKCLRFNHSQELIAKNPVAVKDAKTFNLAEYARKCLLENCDTSQFLQKLGTNNLEELLSRDLLLDILNISDTRKKELFFNFLQDDTFNKKFSNGETLLSIVVKSNNKQHLMDFLRYSENHYYKMDQSTLDHLEKNGDIDLIKSIVSTRGIQKGVHGNSIPIEESMDDSDYEYSVSFFVYVSFDKIF